jgi:hypothetical protein
MARTSVVLTTSRAGTSKFLTTTLVTLSSRGGSCISTSRGGEETLLLASSSSLHSSSSRRARLFTGLARGEVSFAASLEPPSLDDSSTFLLAPLSVALLQQQQGH